MRDDQAPSPPAERTADRTEDRTEDRASTGAPRAAATERAEEQAGGADAPPPAGARPPEAYTEEPGAHRRPEDGAALDVGG